MLASAEIRWMQKGQLPDTLLSWFMAEEELKVEERLDRYLHFPECESIGIKLRDAGDPTDGKFEIKAQRGSSSILRLSPSCAGRIDLWVKITKSTKHSEDWVLSLTSDDTLRWLDISKRRWLRKFSLDDTLEPREVGGTERPDEGCTVELVTLSVEGEAWWSFGFEAFGPLDKVRQNLIEVAKHQLREDVPLTMSILTSASYPTWVASLAS
jgi:hypothetical protein